MLLVKRFLDTILGWFVGGKENAIQTIVDEYTPVKRKYKKRDAFYVSPDGDRASFPQTFSELLDDLKQMFDLMKLPTSNSWITADERIGLTRLGVYLPHPWFMDNPEVKTDPRIEDLTKFPAMMCAAFPVEQTKEKWSSPHLMFAMRLKQFPLGVEPVEGIPYKMGFAIEFNKVNHWYCMWAAVDPITGEINFCKELRRIPINIDKYTHYVQKQNAFSVLLDADEEHKRTQEQNLHVYRVIFAQVFNWWVARKDKSWNVSVKKGKQRLTFSINRKETKRYFADRNKVIVANGKSKKIIHYVSEHIRVVNNKKIVIKEHLRGEDKFTWNGYDCVVTAPKFNDLLSVNFDLAPEEDIDVNEFHGQKLLGMNRVAQLIAAMEDKGKARKENSKWTS